MAKQESVSFRVVHAFTQCVRLVRSAEKLRASTFPFPFSPSGLSLSTREVPPHHPTSWAHELEACGVSSIRVFEATLFRQHFLSKIIKIHSLLSADARMCVVF